ncbi:MAG: zf-HC2 domain-containing protein [bacterium]|nr:zf-HC2 domain-containing protein [bacterium]
MTARHMDGLDCIDPEVGALLVQYGLGTLDEQDCERFERHVLECRACQQELDSAGDALDLMFQQRASFEKKARREKQDYDSLLDRRAHLVRTRNSLEKSIQESAHFGTQPTNWLKWLLAPAAGLAAILLIIFQFRSADSPDIAHTDGKNKTHRIEEFRGSPAALIGVIGVSRAMSSDTALTALIERYAAGDFAAVLDRTSIPMNESQAGFAAQMLRGGAFLLAQPDSAYACFLRAQNVARSEDERIDADVYAARAAAAAGHYGTARRILGQYDVPESNRRAFAEKWIPFLDSLAAEQQAP